MKDYATYVVIAVTVLVVSCESAYEESVVVDDTPPRAASVSSGIVAEAKEFIDMWAAGDYASASSKFDSVMADAMPASVLEQSWKAVVAQAGQFEQQIGTRTAEFQRFDTVYVTCRFERSPVTFRIHFNDVGQISGLWVE